MKFNPDEYEPVEERVKRFYADHPTGSILTKMESSPDNMDFAVFSAEVLVDGAIRARGWAQEVRDKELSKNKQGYEYESVNYTSWLENAETSAIGRALANFNYAGSKRPSREEMQKAQHRESMPSSPPVPLVPPEEIEFRKDDLLTYLEHSKGVIAEDAANKLREAVARREKENSPQKFAEFLKTALNATVAEVKKKEALLAANTNPMAAAVGKLAQAAKDAGKVPTAEKPGELYGHD